MVMADYVDAVWAVLVDRAGAHADDHAGFVHLFPGCVEFRFMGLLGAGGKVWHLHDQTWVGCYREDSTPEREAVMAEVNPLLAELRAQLDLRGGHDPACGCDECLLGVGSDG